MIDLENRLNRADACFKEIGCEGPDMMQSKAGLPCWERGCQMAPLDFPSEI